MAARRTAAVATIGAAIGAALWMAVTEPAPTAPAMPIVACVPETECLLPCIDRAETEANFCFACHDGSIGPAVEHLDGTHPYDALLASARWDARVRFPLDSRIVLVNGRVTCTSCHNYWAVPRLAHWVAAPSSALCIACHAK